MDNLIMNSQWAPGPGGGPQYFSGVGPITYDNLSINGYRTCSVTLTPPAQMMAQDFFIPLINVRGRAGISWGSVIRVVDADYIAMTADFYDGSMNPVKTFEDPVRERITYEFSQVVSRFIIPFGAEYVRLSTKFTGKVTACTFYAPVAFYS